MKTAIIKTMSEEEETLARCPHSNVVPILESAKGNLKANSPKKSGCSKVLSDVIQTMNETFCLWNQSRK